MEKALLLLKTQLNSKIIHKEKTNLLKFQTDWFFLCDLVEIRTQDPQLRRLLLYPAELRDQKLFFKSGAKVQYFSINTNSFSEKAVNQPLYLLKNE